MRNVARAGAEPKLSPAAFLVAPGLPIQTTLDADGNAVRPNAPTRDIRLCVTDYNDDGRLDLLLGDAWFLTRSKSTLSAEELERRREAFAAYSQVSQQLRLLQKTAPGETATERKTHEARIAIRTAQCARAWRTAYADRRTSRHGSVWLLLREN